MEPTKHTEMVQQLESSGWSVKVDGGMCILAKDWQNAGTTPFYVVYAEGESDEQALSRAAQFVLKYY